MAELKNHSNHFFLCFNQDSYGMAVDLDIVDRREIKNLDGENFWRYIGKSDVQLEGRGHLSPVTVAKAIEYGVNLLRSFIEGYVGSNQALCKEADFA